MKKYVIDEMSKFKNFGDLENFVNTLETEQIYQLGQWLSAWRNNRLYELISTGPEYWPVNRIYVSDIKVTKVNDKVNPLLERDNYLLEKISKDKEICNHNEFRSQENINSKSFIARKRGDKFEIIDGIHRAVRLACDGVREFELIYFEIR